MMGVQSLGPITPRRVAESTLAGSRAPTQRLDEAAFDDTQAARALERNAWVTLLGVPGLGPITFAELLAAFGSARAVLETAAQPCGMVRLREALAESPDESTDGLEAPSVEGVESRSDSGGTESTAADQRPAGHGPTRRPGLGADLARRICESAGGDSRTTDLVRSLGLTVVTLDDPAYPVRLRRVDMPPPLLFVRGVLECLDRSHAVAVVGTRWPTDKGRLIAGWIGSALARAGAVVVSGLAVGIDGAAHAAVVTEGLPTVAVLGGGHARLFPRAHERLADAIVAAGGAVVAELPPETPATRGTFPRRNRLVSGLSDATVVVEAGHRSGALITAGWALEQGRDCFLVPGPIDSLTSAGCNEFLRTFPGQARVVCGVPELIEDLGLADDPSEGAKATEAGAPGRVGSPKRRVPGPEGTGPSRSAILASLGPVERLLAEALTTGPATADDLAQRTSLAGAAVLSALTLLELRGLVSGSYGRYIPAGPLAGWSG